MADTPYDILVVGELNVDIILSGDVTPVFDQVERLVSDSSLVLGSSSAIFACGAARLGLNTSITSKIGQDTLGEFCLNALKNRNVDVSGVFLDPGVKTGMSLILNCGVDRAILTYPGSMENFSLEDINPDLLRKTRHLHLGGYYLLSTLRPQVVQLFNMARSLGITTSLDTNYDPSGRWEEDLEPLLRLTNVFLPNETELLRISRESSIEAGLKKLAGWVEMVVVKQGAHGATARKGDQDYKAAGLPMKVVDTVGAGDTFDAGFLYGYLHNWDLQRSLRLGCICGSLSTRLAGGTQAQPNFDEASKYLDT